MVEIISKRSGPDWQDHEIKRLLGENRQTIDRLANHLTQGAWSARNSAPPKPQPERRSRLGFTPSHEEQKIEPRVRISPNDRVILMDAVTSRQIAFLGVIRGTRQARHFVLATKECGFTAPLADDLAHELRELDGAGLDGPGAEDELARTITTILGLPCVQSDDSEAPD